MDVLESIIMPGKEENLSPYRKTIMMGQSIRDQFMAESVNLNFEKQEEGPSPTNYEERDPLFRMKQSLNIVYNCDSVLKNEKIKYNESFINMIKNGRQILHNEKTMIIQILNPDIDIGKIDVIKNKIIKNHKYYLSKIIKLNGKINLFVLNSLSQTTFTIQLDSIFEMPNKCHVIDPVKGYAFIYNNAGTIFVFSASLDGKWGSLKSDKERKICNLITNDLRIDPTMHLINLNDGTILLFLIGGYEMVNKTILYTNDILVFAINFQIQQINLEPSLKIKLRYPRIKPLVFHYKTLSKSIWNTRIFILGGGFSKKLKKDLASNNESERIAEALKSCETISLKMIEDKLYSNQFANKQNNNDFSIEKTFQLTGNNKIVQKFFSLTEAAIFKVRFGKNSDKTKKPIIIGAGKSKRSIYQIDHIDEVGEKIHVKKIANGIMNNPGFLCNNMIKLKNKEIFFLFDDDKEIYQRFNLESLENSRPNSCGCNLL